MTQTTTTDIDPTITSGTQLSDIIDANTASNLTSHSGSARPPYLPAGGLWLDSSDAGNLVLTFFDGTEDIPFITFDVANNTFSMQPSNIAEYLRVDGTIPMTGNLKILNGAPILDLQCTAAVLNEQRWEFLGSPDGSLTLRTIDDDGTSSSSAIVFERNGITPTRMTLHAGMQITHTRIPTEDSDLTNRLWVQENNLTLRTELDLNLLITKGFNSSYGFTNTPAGFSTTGGVLVLTTAGALVNQIYTDVLQQVAVRSTTDGVVWTAWEILSSRAYVDTGDATTLTAANDYTDSKIDVTEYLNVANGTILYGPSSWTLSADANNFTVVTHGLGLGDPENQSIILSDTTGPNSDGSISPLMPRVILKTSDSFVIDADFSENVSPVAGESYPSYDIMFKSTNVALPAGLDFTLSVALSASGGLTNYGFGSGFGAIVPTDYNGATITGFYAQTADSNGNVNDIFQLGGLAPSGSTLLRVQFVNGPSVIMVYNSTTLIYECRNVILRDFLSANNNTDVSLRIIELN